MIKIAELALTVRLKICNNIKYEIETSLDGVSFAIKDKVYCQVWDSILIREQIGYSIEDHVENRE